MGLRSEVYRRIIYPAVDRLYGRDSFAALETLRRLRALPPEAALAERQAQLRRLLLHAWDHVPFYRDHWTSSGAQRGDLEAPDALSRLPVLTKALVRENAERLLADNASGEMKQFRTSGSTGRPLAVLEDPHSNAWRRALKWEFLDWWKIGMADRGALVWFLPVQGMRARLTRRLGFALNNCHTLLQADRLLPEEMTRFWMLMARRRVEWLYGYTSSLATLGRFARASGLTTRHPLRLRLVVPTAEVLYEEQRRAMVEGFGCPVADEYGSSELGDLAFECPSGELHVAAETYHLEVMEPYLTVASGQAGAVAVTNLRKTSMPMIRYLLADMVHQVDRSCDCGRRLPILQSVVGRVSDVVRLPDGRAIHSTIFDHLMRGFGDPAHPAVSAFRAVQTAPTTIELLVVPGAAWVGDTASRIPREFSRVFGADFTTLVTTAPDIPADPNGKMRYFISNVPASPM